jgi:bacteriocin-type transport-associated protein
MNGTGPGQFFSTCLGAAMRRVLYLLGQLSDLDVEWLISKGRKERIAKGAVLIQQQRPIDTLYIVLEGTLGVSITTRDTPQLIKLGCGEVVGEMSFVDSRPPSATVSALMDSIVLAISRDELMQRLEQAPDFAARFYRAIAVFLSHRLRATVQQLGWGKSQPLDEDAEYEGELDPSVLDNVHLAGSRFDRVLQRLLTG